MNPLAELLPDGWEVYDPNMGMSALLLCPCGNVIEQDGICPNGHESPLRTMGVI
jgi:hypothetical protein